jgi:hypothetical protein
MTSGLQLEDWDGGRHVPAFLFDPVGANRHFERNCAVQAYFSAHCAG